MSTFTQVSITSSITASLAELLFAGSPGASLPDDLYQLKLLWNGIKTAVEQKRRRLERIRDLWREFEEKKEEFIGFLGRVETRLREFPPALAQAMDFAVIQNEIETQKVGRHRNELRTYVVVTWHKNVTISLSLDAVLSRGGACV